MMHFRTLRSQSLFFSLLLSGGLANAAPPVVGGLSKNNPLDERQSGQVLLDELRCAACHKDIAQSNATLAPDLTEVGTRLTLNYLEKFIAHPAQIHPGTTMPDLLSGKSTAERDVLAESLAHYLGSLKSKEAPEAEAPDPQAGKVLFHETGCIACHNPRDESGQEVPIDGLFSLSHLPGKYQPGQLAAFLHSPLKSRPSGRMPDLKLSKKEAASIASYLYSAEAGVVSKVQLDQIDAGRKAFQELNCIACHHHDETARTKVRLAPALSGTSLDQGCLAPGPKSAPNYSLDESQINAIRTALEDPVKPFTAEEKTKMHLTQLNCIACHSRDNYGGVDPSIDSYFHTSEEALGNEARIPPPLTLIGAKLRPEWMNKVLYDGESIRPYMKTRMPQFGAQALHGLAELFAEVDHLEPVAMTPPERESDPMIRNGAHLLIGDQGLNCIACHNYNGKESPGMKGLDLMTSYQRLQPAWFYNYLLDPGAFRPGILMPSYWPDGKAVQTEILDGNTQVQLSALWHQFSLGTSARDPSGLVQEDTKLVVTDQPRTYRGRSEVAGYRGIAVGFPEDLNFAFNAQNGALSALWSGEFVRVGWRGQGAGDFNPLARPVRLGQDVAFLQLPEKDSPWPLRPIRTKEVPINPDPLYPRNHGYAFRGYSFDRNSVPTFRYRSGEIEIEDTIIPVEESGKQLLRRTLTFTSPSATHLDFRALTGTIEQESATAFSSDKIRLILAPASTVLRKSPDPEAGRELLIGLELSAGNSTYTLDYELLP